MVAGPAAALLAGAFALAASVTPASAATNLLTNPGFETGSLSGWSCSAIDSVTSSPVHSGTHALQGAANNSDNAQCTQTVSVQPSSSYTLSGWVEGNYVFIGDTGTGATDTNNWTTSATTWQQLSTTFTTGASTTSVTVYVHGWYAQGTYFADDLALSGAAGSGGGGGGGGGTAPAAPTGLTVTGTSSSSVSLSWTAPAGTVTGYNVYENGTKALSVTTTSATVAGLAASTTYSFAVTATNSVGESPKSGSVSATTSAAGGGGPPPGSFAVAPYVDMTNNQEPMLNSAASAGLKAFTTAFVIASGCTPIWGDTLPVTNDPTVSGEITTAESDGAQPIVSFGGASGIELAQACTNLSQLTAAYQSVINTLHVTHIDFDIEGAAIADTADNATRFQAIKALESANPGLIVSVTIPVLPTGPVSSGDAFLQQAQSIGARIDIINIMTMDYGSSFDTAGADMGSYAIEAAQDTLSFAKTVWPAMTYANIGVTPMIGVNDDSAEDFSEADAHSLVTFAQQNHLGRLAFWSVDRDQPCGGSASGLASCSEISQAPLDFTKIFDQFTG